MELELSSVCPECNELHTMEIKDSENKLITPGDYFTEDEYELVSLTEVCGNCGFEQTKGADYDPDSMPGGHDDY